MKDSELKAVILKRDNTLILTYDVMKIRKLLFSWCCHQRKIKVVFYKHTKLNCGKHTDKKRVDKYYEVCPCCKRVTIDYFSRFDID